MTSNLEADAFRATYHLESCPVSTTACKTIRPCSVYKSFSPLAFHRFFEGLPHLSADRFPAYPGSSWKNTLCLQLFPSVSLWAGPDGPKEKNFRVASWALTWEES